jgi:hypothetical protein
MLPVPLPPGIAIGLFVLGAVLRMYTRLPPEGSPLTRIFRVLKGE